MFSRSNGCWSHMEMKSPEVSIRFVFYSSVSLWDTNRGQIFRLPKSSRTMMCAVSLLMPKSSAINLRVSRRSCTQHLSHFLHHFLRSVCWWPTHPQSFPSLRESVWTISKHIFCSRLPSHTRAPTFHETPLLFSPICSRTWRLQVAPLRYDTTSHTDYVQLAVVGLHCRSHVVHTVWGFFPWLWRTMRMRAHMHQVAVEVWHHSLNFLDTHSMLIACM